MTITVDFSATRLRVSSDQASLDVGALYDVIQAAQASEIGSMYGPIAAGAGLFDLGGGRSSGLTVRLNTPWQVEFQGSGQRTIDGGTLIGGNSGQPVAMTAAVQVILNRPADAFAVATSGNDPATIATAVWGHATAATLLDRVSIAHAILRNKTVTDPVTGLMTVFDTDGVTPLLTAQLHEDAAGTQTYRGQGAERRERLA